MTTTDELREAVARQLDPAAFHTLLSSEPSLRKREARSKADRIIRIVVDACAQEARKAGTYERRVWDSVWREYDEVTEEVAGLDKIVDAISALAPEVDS